MKQIIYVDILVIVNLFVNYFLLLATAKFFCIKWKTARLILGEILGGIYSLYILAPELPWFISSVIKLFMSVTIIAATFGIKKPTQFFKILIYFYSVNFLFSGIMMAVWCWFKPNGMQVNNGVVYFNISPVILIISTIISYIIIEAINKIVNKRRLDHKIINLKIKFRTNQISITAKIDTGNFLKEPFSGLPVIVARETSVKPLLPVNTYEQIKDYSADKFTDILNLKIRMIPFKTISEESVLPAFKPDCIKINESEVQKEVYIALCEDKFMPQNAEALINPEILD